MKTWLEAELDTANMRVSRWELEWFRTAHTRELMILANNQGKRDALENVFWVKKRTRKSSIDSWLTSELTYSDTAVVRTLKTFSETRNVSAKAGMNYAIGYRDNIAKIVQHLNEREN